MAVELKYSALKPKCLLHLEFLASCLIDPSLSEEHHKAIACLVSLEALRDTYWQNLGNQTGVNQKEHFGSRVYNTSGYGNSDLPCQGGNHAQFLATDSLHMHA